MLEALFLGGLVFALSVITWTCGYYIGKAKGIREVRYLLDDQWRDYEEFRDFVFRELGIEADE